MILHLLGLLLRKTRLLRRLHLQSRVHHPQTHHDVLQVHQHLLHILRRALHLHLAQHLARVRRLLTMKLMVMAASSHTLRSRASSQRALLATQAP